MFVHLNNLKDGFSVLCFNGISFKFYLLNSLNFSVFYLCFVSFLCIFDILLVLVLFFLFWHRVFSFLF